MDLDAIINEAEVQIKNKCNSFLDFVMAEEHSLQATSHSMKFRSKCHCGTGEWGKLTGQEENQE